MVRSFLRCFWDPKKKLANPIELVSAKHVFSNGISPRAPAPWTIPQPSLAKVRFLCWDTELGVFWELLGSFRRNLGCCALQPFSRYILAPEHGRFFKHEFVAKVKVDVPFTGLPCFYWILPAANFV